MNQFEYDLILINEELTEVAEAATHIIQHHLVNFAGINTHKADEVSLLKQDDLAIHFLTEANELIGSHVNYVRNFTGEDDYSITTIEEIQDFECDLLPIVSQCLGIQHTICKALRFGLNDSYTGDELNNKQNIEKGLSKLFSMLGAYFKSIKQTGFLDKQDVEKKIARINKYKQYSIDVGRLNSGYLKAENA